MRNFLLALFIFSFIPGLAQTHSRLKPARNFKLDSRIPEGSGLAAWNGKLWTQNDSGDASLFSIDTASGKIIEEHKLGNLKNTDWEDLAQDGRYFYIGDTGNNLGERDTVYVFRVEKQSLLQNRPVIDTISFNWPETETKTGKQRANFDCEALVSIGDSLYLFTKEWKHTRQTRLFSLPNKPGKYTAKYKSRLATRVLVTGATYDEHRGTLVLCGYNLWLKPFLLVFPNASKTDLLSGKFTKAKLKLPFRQVEGVTVFDDGSYFVINENWKFLFLHTPAEIHRLQDLKD
jgi:hypothetical protein